MRALLRRLRRLLAPPTGPDGPSDPRRLLEQAVARAQSQHARLRSQAAAVLAHEREVANRLAGARRDLERLSRAAREALAEAVEAQRRGEAGAASEAESAAERLAARAVAAKRRVEALEALHSDAAETAAYARRAVERSAAALEARLLERERLLSRLTKARLEEQLHRVLGGHLGGAEEAAALEQAREEIEKRHARALAEAELEERSPSAPALELDAATRDLEAKAWLKAQRQELESACAKPERLDLPDRSDPGP